MSMVLLLHDCDAFLNVSIKYLMILVLISNGTEPFNMNSGIKV